MTEVIESGTQTSAPTPEQRLVSFFAKGETTTPEAAPAPEAPADTPEPTTAEQDTTDEPTVDDLTDDEPQAPAPDAGELEITFNGETIKLTKAEAQERAQLGELYRRNQERTEATWQQAQAIAQQAQQMAQVVPELQQAHAMVTLYERAMAQFDPQQMRALASTDPAAYLEKRAEYDQIAMQHQQARATYEQHANQFQQHQKSLKEAALAQEFEMLPKLVPQWRDKTRAAAERKELAEALHSRKVRPQTMEALAGNAELMAMAYKAHKYDQLQAGKRDKLAQVAKAPAALKPGVAPQPGQERTERFQKARGRLAKTGSADDFAAALLAKGFR